MRSRAVKEICGGFEFPEVLGCYKPERGTLIYGSGNQTIQVRLIPSSA